MSACPSCGGIIGRDCWNPQECAQITAQMQWEQMPTGTPVAYRVKDFADGWIYTSEPDEACKLSKGSGSLIQPLYLGQGGSAERDGMGRAPSPTGQLRDSQKHPPTNSTEALEAIIIDVLDKWHDGMRERKAREIAAALASHLRELQEENERQGFLLALMAACAEDQENRSLAAWVGACMKLTDAEALASTYREENERLRQDVIAFCAPWAVTYARDHGYPPGHLHPAHYDILARAGGRMVDFTRHDEALTTPRTETDQ